MSVLNFPTTRPDGSPLQPGDQYTGNNGVLYIFDGDKWVGHSPAATFGVSNAITNNTFVVQVDTAGNLVIPDNASIIFQSGKPVTSSVLANNSFTLSLSQSGTVSFINTSGSTIDEFITDAGVRHQDFEILADNNIILVSNAINTSTSTMWIFANDGTLVFPDNTIQTTAWTGIGGVGYGYAGSQGFLGYVGSIGYAGSQGITGYTGSRGDIGYSGSIGYTGSQGDIGYSGSIGYAGSQGDTGYVGSFGYTGSQGLQGPKGQDGAFGGVAVEYYYSNNTANVDPGSGTYSLNSIDLSTATYLYVNQTDVSGINLSNYIDVINFSSSAIKGALKIQDKNNISDYAFYSIIGSSTQVATYFQVPIAYLSGVTTFTNNLDSILTFARTGDKGDQGIQGYAGSIGDLGYVGSIGYTGSIGYAGSFGTTGYVGSLGYTGSIGYTGSFGTTGYIGSLGYTGSFGTTGYIGSIGYVGSFGTTGYIGSLGYTGSFGTTGYIGSIGYTGSFGTTGYVGTVSYTHLTLPTKRIV